MGNHCIDVVCVGCGRCYCLRGCNYDHPPDPKIAAKAKKRWAHQKHPFDFEDHCCQDDLGRWYPTPSDSLIMGED